MAKRTKLEPDEGDEGVARERTCALTRKKGSTDELIRFVADPGGNVMPDLAAKLPGRGVWLDGTREVVERAVATKAFSRSLKHAVSAGPDLAEQTEFLLRRRALEGFSVANKAGEILVGFSKIEAAIMRSNGPVVLVHATEAAADGRRKLEGKLRKTLGDAQPTIIRIFTGVELSLALGYPNVIHASLTGGGASDFLLANIARYIRFSGLNAVADATAGDPDETDQIDGTEQGCTGSE